MTEVSSIGDELDKQEDLLQEIQREMHEFVSFIPNLVHADVPDGVDENDNLEVRKWGEIPQFSFKPREHFELEKIIDSKLMDFTDSVKLSGARFVVLRQGLARMHRALPC